MGNKQYNEQQNNEYKNNINQQQNVNNQVKQQEQQQDIEQQKLQEQEVNNQLKQEDQQTNEQLEKIEENQSQQQQNIENQKIEEELENENNKRSTRRSNRGRQPLTPSNNDINSSSQLQANSRSRRTQKEKDPLSCRVLQGIAILYIHQVNGDMKYYDEEILNRKELQNQILISLKSLQRSYVTERQNCKDVRNYPLYSSNDILIDDFEIKNINKMNWPVIVSYEIKISFEAFRKKYISQSSSNQSSGTQEQESGSNASTQNNLSNNNQFENKNEIYVFTDTVFSTKYHLKDAFHPNQVTMHTNFWTKKYDFEEIRKPLRVIENFWDIVNEYGDDEGVQSLNISQESFNKNYQYLMYIGGGSYGKVDMYYNIRNDTICAVKYFIERNLTGLKERIRNYINATIEPEKKEKKKYKTKNKREQVNQNPYLNSTVSECLLSLSDDEIQRLKNGSLTLDFDDTPIEGNGGRNILREIKASYILNQSQYINKDLITELQGLVIVDKQKYHLPEVQIQQKSSINNNQSQNNSVRKGRGRKQDITEFEEEPTKRIQTETEFVEVESNYQSGKKKKKRGQQQQDEYDEEDEDDLDVIQMMRKEEESKQNGQSVKIIFEHFGSCEMKNKKMFCDLFNYISNNLELFKERKYVSIFIKDIFNQAIKGIECIHKSNVLIRDFKDDNILIRRVYNEQNWKQPKFQIKFCDFGLAKLLTEEEMEQGGRPNSIDYEVVNEFRHPRFHKGKTEKLSYHQKDDIFGLGVLLIRLYQNFPHQLHKMDHWTKELISYITGFSNKSFQQYSYYLQRIQDDNKQATEEEIQKPYQKLIGQLKMEGVTMEQCWERIPHISDIVNHKTYQDWMKNSLL